MKRIFLVKNTKETEKNLLKNSLTCKLYKYKDKYSYMYEFSNYSCVLEEYKKSNKGLNLLFVISDTNILLDEEINNLKEVTDDIRYSKKYLTLFGDPKKYEFEIERVFKKCDSVGLEKMDLNFEMGMSVSKVFRVILYRLSQFYFEDNTKIKKLKKAYKMARSFFDREVINNLIESIEEPEIYSLNFKAFIEEDMFFETDLSKQAVYFFDKKDKLFELVRG